MESNVVNLGFIRNLGTFGPGPLTGRMNVGYSRYLDTNYNCRRLLGNCGGQQRPSTRNGIFLLTLVSVEPTRSITIPTLIHTWSGSDRTERSRTGDGY